MKLYLVRHGDAVSEQQNRERPLSPKGLADVRKLAKLLKPHGLNVDCIWHSTLSRAVETAGVLATAIKASHGLKESADLMPDDPIGPIRKEIKSADGDLMIVGHEPFLGLLASKLLTGSKSGDAFDIAKGAMLCLECESDDVWKLHWMITPDLIA